MSSSASLGAQLKQKFDIDVGCYTSNIENGELICRLELRHQLAYLASTQPVKNSTHGDIETCVFISERQE